jgi:hypothetical protein
MEHVKKSWHSCSQCDNWFETEQFLSIHQATKHKIRKSTKLQQKSFSHPKVTSYTSPFTSALSLKNRRGKDKCSKNFIKTVEV